MPIDWKVAYEAAIQERDPAKLKSACFTARCAIVDRLLEIRREPAEITAEEREVLKEACRKLALHEWGV